MKGEGNVTPQFELVCINVCDVYIVMNHGVELKAKTPPSIQLCYVSVIGTVTDGMSGHATYILNCGIM